MAEKIIRDDARIMRRRLHQAVGKSVFKTIAEPITNSDDSYRRAIQDGVLEPGKVYPIYIIADRRKNKRPLLRVVDWGEAMTDEEMDALFAVYGKEKSGISEGKKVRGLFGQGITDVLLFHQHGNIKSIKGRHLYECKFYVKDDGDRAFDPRKSSRRIDENLRRALYIPEGNGTVVSFELAEGVAWPTKIVEKLERFPMMRLINSDPERGVRYIEKKNGKVVAEKTLRYKFPEGKQVIAWEGTLQFEDYGPVKLELEVSQASGELHSDENGILVFDEENAVYALTLFGLEAIPGHDQLFGRLRLTGARDIIRTKLNQKEGTEAILSDDREGFNQSTDFYKALSQLVQEQVRPLLLEQNKKATPDTPEEDLTKNEKEVFDVFNQVFNEIVNHDKPLIVSSTKTLEPPKDGLAFDRGEIKTTIDRNYGVGLNINTELIPYGTKVKLSSDTSTILVTPDELVVAKDMLVEGNLARKHVFVSGSVSDEVGLITASSDERNTHLLVEVKPEVFIYPKVLQFEPSDINVAPEKKYNAKLFVNTEKVPVGSTISLLYEGVKAGVPTEAVVTDDSVLYDEVALITIPLTVQEEGHSTLTASFKDTSVTLGITCRKPTPSGPTSPNAAIRGWDFINLPDQWYVCFYDPMPESERYGYLLVNSDHPLNKHYFGVNPTKESVRQSEMAMTYLCEVLTNEMLDVAYKEKLQEERSSGGDPFTSDSHAYVKKYIGQKKREIGPLIHQKWLGQ